MAYVGDATNVTRSLAVALLRLGVNVTVGAPAGYQLERGRPGGSQRGHRRRDAATDRIGRGRREGRRRRVHRRLGLDGLRGRDRAAAHRPRVVSRRRRADEVGEEGGGAAALPARAPGRRDHRRRARWRRSRSCGAKCSTAAQPCAASFVGSKRRSHDQDPTPTSDQRVDRTRGHLDRRPDRGATAGRRDRRDPGDRDARSPRARHHQGARRARSSAHRHRHGAQGQSTRRSTTCAG